MFREQRRSNKIPLGLNFHCRNSAMSAHQPVSYLEKRLITLYVKQLNPAFRCFRHNFTKSSRIIRLIVFLGASP